MGSCGERVAAKSIQHEKSLDVYSDGGLKVMGWATPRFWSANGYATSAQGWDILTDKTAYVLPPGSIALADNSVAILKRNGMFYGNATRLSSWEDLHKYVKYEPLRVVRVGWSS